MYIDKEIRDSRFAFLQNYYEEKKPEEGMKEETESPGLDGVYNTCVNVIWRIGALTTRDKHDAAVIWALALWPLETNTKQKTILTKA